MPIYSAQQLAGIREACRLARHILDTAHAAVRPGVTTDEIDKVVRVSLSQQLVDEVQLSNVFGTAPGVLTFFSIW